MKPLVSTEWLLGLKNSALAEMLRQWLWAYPLVEAVHILGIALFVGSVALFDLRLLGVSRHVLVTDLAQHLLPWAYGSFGIVLLSGCLLFATDAPTIALNPAFRLKILLILVAGMNAIAFHWKFYPTVQQWNRGVKSPRNVQAIALLSWLLWIGVIICGCLIAYV
ncbi:MAG: hypothetical protein IGS48_04770 [Oscillatoriales cyanobacterium C42_A2020_001]|nr:hypothetical protein [Leptolyngbyaceae cyanobacterium C42_A2020_001]